MLRSRGGAYHRAVVGIALLTLSPGHHGGSEVSTRELLRALGRVGTLDYRVFLPPVAPAAGEGLPSIVVDEYRPARSTRERAAAMAAASTASRSCTTRSRSRSHALTSLAW